MKRSFSGATDLSLLLDDYDLDLLLEDGSRRHEQLEGAKGHFQTCESLCDSFFEPNVDLHPLKNMQKMYEGPFLSERGHSFSDDEDFRAEGNADCLASSLSLKSESDASPLGPHSFTSRPDSGSPEGTFLTHYGSSPSIDTPTSSARTMSSDGRQSAAKSQARTPGKRGRGRASHSNPSPSTLAQRRYHERQKQKHAEEERKMEEMRSKMEQLMTEKKVLESKNQMLVKDMLTWQSHVETLWNQESVRVTSQFVTLKLTAELIARVTRRSISVQEAKEWTLGEFVYTHYQKFIDRERELCDVITSSTSPRKEDTKELEILWEMQRQIEVRGGLGSSIHLSMWALNMGETARRQGHFPEYGFWEDLVDGVLFSEEQVDKILSSYEWMHKTITRTMQERENDILPLLYRESAFVPREKMHCCSAAKRLYRSLRTEQTTVLGFMMHVEKVLSKIQKAYFECKSYPWSVDWLYVCRVLMLKRGCSPLIFPDVRDQGANLDIFPKATAFQVFTFPITAMGLGSRFKVGVCLCPFETVMSRLCFPNPPLELMSQVKLLNAMTGSWRRYTCWQWMQKVKEVGMLIKNDVLQPNIELQQPFTWHYPVPSILSHDMADPVSSNTEFFYNGVQ